MQSQDKDIIYSVVSDMEAFRAVIEDHIASLGEVFIRSAEGQYFVTTARRFNLEGDLECDFPMSETIATPTGSNITVDFYYLDDRYHFESVLNYKSTYFTIPLPQTIFQKQKRTQFRFDVPEDYLSRFSLRINHEVDEQYLGRIMDISLDGCAIEWTGVIPNLGRQTAILGDLLLGGGASFSVRGIICFKTVKDQALRIGLEFMELSPSSAAALRQAIARLQKDIFIKNN